MNIILKTLVKGHYLSVMKHFNVDLFMALKPKFGKIDIVSFTGTEVGDSTHVRFLSPIKADWISDITEKQVTENEAFFIDKGRVLPPGMRSWQHKHIVRKVSETESEIIDDMTFEAKNIFWAFILFPSLYLGFYPRKKLYKQYFGNLN